MVSEWRGGVAQRDREVTGRLALGQDVYPVALDVSCVAFGERGMLQVRNTEEEEWKKNKKRNHVLSVTEVWQECEVAILWFGPGFVYLQHTSIGTVDRGLGMIVKDQDA